MSQSQASKDLNARPFFFRQRYGKVDWKGVSTLDVDAVVEEVDVRPLQALLDNIAFANLQVADLPLRGAEDELMIKLFRIAQLMVEYLLHTQEHLSNSIKKLEVEKEDANRHISDLKHEIKLADRNEKKLKREVKQYQKVLTTCQNMLLHYGVDATALFQMLSMTNPVPIDVPQPSSSRARAKAETISAHVCAVCGKAFSSAEYLSRHETRRHSGKPVVTREVAPPAPSQAEMKEEVRRLVQQETEKLQAMLHAFQKKEEPQESSSKIMLPSQVDNTPLLEELRQKDAKITELKRLVDKEVHLSKELAEEVKILQNKLEAEKKKFEKRQEAWALQRFGRAVYQAFEKQQTLVLLRKFRKWNTMVNQMHADGLLKRVTKMEREAKKKIRSKSKSPPRSRDRSNSRTSKDFLKNEPLPPVPELMLPDHAKSHSQTQTDTEAETDSGHKKPTCVNNTSFSVKEMMEAFAKRVDLTVTRYYGEDPFGENGAASNYQSHFGSTRPFAPKLKFSHKQFLEAREEVLDELDQWIEDQYGIDPTQASGMDDQKYLQVEAQRAVQKQHLFSDEVKEMMEQVQKELEIITKESYTPSLNPQFTLFNRRRRKTLRRKKSSFLNESTQEENSDPQSELQRALAGKPFKLKQEQIDSLVSEFELIPPELLEREASMRESRGGSPRLILAAEEQSFGITKDLFAKYRTYAQDQQREGMPHWNSFEQWIQDSFDERQKQYKVQSSHQKDIAHELKAGSVSNFGSPMQRLAHEVLSGSSTSTELASPNTQRKKVGALYGHPISEGSQSAHEVLQAIEVVLRREIRKPDLWQKLQETTASKSKQPDQSPTLQRHVSIGGDDDDWNDAETTASKSKQPDQSPTLQRHVSIGVDGDDWNDAGSLTINTDKAAESGLPPRHTGRTPNFRPDTDTEKATDANRSSNQSAFFSADDAQKFTLNESQQTNQEQIAVGKSLEFHTPHQSLDADTLNQSKKDESGRKNAEKKAPAHDDFYDDFSDLNLSEDELL